MTPTPPPDPRVVLAAERTLLAWVRTGLALMGFGFVVARFGLFLQEVAHARPAAQAPGGSLAFGVALVGLGVAVLVGSGWRHRRYVTALAAGNGTPPGPGFALLVTAALAAGGVAMAAYLLTTG